MISLVVVNYRSSHLAIEAIQTARAASTRSLQVIVVENSRDPGEAEKLGPHADLLLVSSTNRGYGGAINDARKYCQGNVIIAANPDVRFAPGSIDRLVEPLGENVAVTGPALFWDREYRWFLPPGDLQIATERMSEALATRWQSWHRWRDRARIRARLSFWSLQRPTPVRAISGAVMAISAVAFDQAGGFDERFPLYFEETDLLRRISAAGKEIVYVPASRCHHMYNQSAGPESERAGALYAESERRFLEKWNGPSFVAMLEWIRRPVEPPAFSSLAGRIALDRQDVVIEASPLPSFDTAAGYFPDGDVVDLPTDVLAAFHGSVVYLRVIEKASARVLAVYARRV